jgi:hypothetical protein
MTTKKYQSTIVYRANNAKAERKKRSGPASLGPAREEGLTSILTADRELMFAL